jgi:hypothetical protein
MTIILIVSCSENDNNLIPIVNQFTEIKGTISGELTLSKSPYRITQDIIVDSNSTLIIKPGVELYFEENTKLLVHGKLLVEGITSQYVVFKSYLNTKKWNGIKIINADNPAKFDFVWIQGISQEIDTPLVSASISIMNSEVEFAHSYLSNNSAIHGGAIGTYNSKLIFKNNIVMNNDAVVWGGAIMGELSDILIINNTFYQNTSANSGGSILIYDPTKTELQNNIFYKNTSRIGNPNFEYASNDSSNLIEQYNFIPYGIMNPKFVNELHFLLDQTSPCINNGNPNPAFNDSDNSRNDQGAYGGPLGNW